MGLAPHLLGFHGNDIEDGAVGGEEGVEGEADVVFLNLAGGEVREI